MGWSVLVVNVYARPFFSACLGCSNPKSGMFQQSSLTVKFSIVCDTDGTAYVGNHDTEKDIPHLVRSRGGSYRPIVGHRVV